MFEGATKLVKQTDMRSLKRHVESKEKQHTSCAPLLGKYNLFYFSVNAYIGEPPAQLHTKQEPLYLPHTEEELDQHYRTTLQKQLRLHFDLVQSISVGVCPNGKW